eukprot:scaffold25095_cov51-Attheya_sp.AAC.8
MDRILSAPPPPPPPPKAAQDQMRPAGKGNGSSQRDHATPISTLDVLQDLEDPTSKPPQQQIRPIRGTPSKLNSSPTHRFDTYPGEMDFPRSGHRLNMSAGGTNRNSPEEMPNDELLQDTANFDPKDLFTHSASPSLPPTPEKDSDGVDEIFLDSSVGGNNQFKSFGNSSGTPTQSISESLDTEAQAFTASSLNTDSRPNEPLPASSSIDAFEASFNSAFPTSFATANEESTHALAFDVPEFADPFFLGSIDGSGSNSNNQGRHSSSVSNGENSRTQADSGTTPSQEVGGTVRSGVPNQSNISPTQPTNAPVEHSIESVSASNEQTDSSDNKQAKTFDNFTDSSPGHDLFPPSAMSSFETISKNPAPVTPSKGEFSGDGTGDPASDAFRTPPSFGKAQSQTPSTTVSPQKRPEKTASSSARARYEAALKARGGPKLTSPANKKSDSKQEVSSEGHSPSLLLKRLHQRRAMERSNSSPDKDLDSPDREMPETREKSVSRLNPQRSYGDSDGDGSRRLGYESETAHPKDAAFHRPMIDDKGTRNRMSTTSSRFNQNPQGESAPRPFQATHPRNRGTGNHISLENISAEIRNLDAIASSSSGEGLTAAGVSPSQRSLQSGPGSKRRVKQPVSYAEPSLNSKLRRGDVYFPKVDVSRESTGTNDQGDPSPQNELRSKSSEEVLKDLATPMRQTAS